MNSRASDWLGRQPPCIEGQGGDDQLFKVACGLVRMCSNANEAWDLMIHYNRYCRPPWPENRLRYKLREAERSERSYGIYWNGRVRFSSRGTPSGCRAKSTLNKSVKRNITVEDGNLPESMCEWEQWLWERSALRPDTQTPASFLRSIYEQGDQILILKNVQSKEGKVWEHPGFLRYDATALKHYTEGCENGVYFLMAPIRDKKGVFDPSLGRISVRSSANCRCFPFMLLEADVIDKESWLRLIVQLSLPIVSITDSGGKSLHTLVWVGAEDKSTFDNMCSKLKPSFGQIHCDTASMSAVRMSRLPGCMRGNREQKLLYLNPNPQPIPLLRVPVRETADEITQRLAFRRAAFDLEEES